MSSTVSKTYGDGWHSTVRARKPLRLATSPSANQDGVGGAVGDGASLVPDNAPLNSSKLEKVSSSPASKGVQNENVNTVNSQVSFYGLRRTS